MNKQKRSNSRGIEWTDYTWNPVAGCFHGCQWQMPDGTIAECYAKDVAEGVASPAYRHGFEHHYWHLGRLTEPLSVKNPSKIFLDSMSDLMGHWVPDEQIRLVLNAVDNAHWHTFQLLTKNPSRLLEFQDHFPPNLWIGTSTPPNFMWGKRLVPHAQERMLRKALRILSRIDRVTWMSFEPLSWDVADIVSDYPVALSWAVIGAATNGSKAYQPSPQDVENLLRVLDSQNVPIFFKGNLEWCPWREEFPKDL